MNPALFVFLLLIFSCFALFFAILKTTILMHFVLIKSLNSWKLLRLFITLFLIGYIITLAIMTSRPVGRAELFTVLIFFMGSLFVLLVVNSSFHDIQIINTSRNLLQIRNEELQKVNEQLDAFLYSTAHDLRSPLASILGLVDLGMRVQEISEKNNYLSLIKGRIDKMDYLLKDIIKFSKNKHLEINYEPVDIETLLFEVIRELKFIKKDHTIIETSIHCKEKVVIDYERIKAIVYNLLSNAIQFQKTDEAEGKIRIHAGIENDKFEITIIDNGIGIESHHIHKIYDMFFKGTQLSQGSGLGLYITKEIVGVLGGTISVDSLINQGTIAKVSFPYPLLPFRKQAVQIL